jgi:uncharacterized membrane protein
MIRTPPQWGAEMLSRAYTAIATTRPEDAARFADTHRPVAVRKIGVADLRWALTQGVKDFGASRTDVIFLCIMYPLAGLLMARVASGYQLLPLVFPLASGFALIGPLAGVGLNEISRRREKGQSATWFDALNVFRSPSILSILLLGAVLLGMLLFWLVLSQMVYSLTLGPQPPASIGDFAHSVVYTNAGHWLMFVGIGLGFGLAVVAMTISVVSFPMLLDQNVSLETAIRTSLAAVLRNPLIMALWGLIIAGALVLGSIPLLLGLIFVMPVLGHATWHLYRRIVPS